MTFKCPRIQESDRTHQKLGGGEEGGLVEKFDGTSMRSLMGPY